MSAAAPSTSPAGSGGTAAAPRVPRPAPALRRILSHARLETRVLLSNGEQLMVAIALPAMFAGGVVQVNLLVGRQVASHFEGAISWLSYSDRLYQLPLGVVGAAVPVRSEDDRILAVLTISAPKIRMTPGRIGTITPTIPMTMTMPTTISPQIATGAE